jgi:5-hydroxyisourate hydrolase-like protein (transthyretin family)
MGRFIITEEEKSRIRGLYEMVGDKLSPEGLQSPKAQGTKDQATFLNYYYGTNLPSATTGSWTDKDFNDTLKKFMVEKGIPVWICKKGDGYCADGDEGEVTTKEMDKLKQSMSLQQEDKSSTFLSDFAKMYGVPVEDISNINVSSGQTQIDILKNTLMGPLKEVTLQHVRDNGSFDKVLNQLKSYYNGQIGAKGVMNEEQKLWLNDFIKLLETTGPQLVRFWKGLPQEKVSVKVGDTNYVPSTEVLQTVKSDLYGSLQGLPQEKINTTNDRTYDYKLSGGKYYYSLKGQNKWIEANGKGLESIKSKINFS